MYGIELQSFRPSFFRSFRWGRRWCGCRRRCGCIPQGELAWAIFLALYGLVVVCSIDNVIKPYLISRGGSLPLLLVLMGVLGGVLAFGFIGVLLGPVFLPWATPCCPSGCARRLRRRKRRRHPPAIPLSFSMIP
jgi:hypothetical protein